MAAARFLENVPLAPLTTLGVGGNARFFCRADSEEGVLDALEFAASKSAPLAVLGGGSNMVISDTGFAGCVLQVNLKGHWQAAREDATVLEAAAGENWDNLVAHCVAQGLQGFECLSGIPGSVGATPIQNVGAYGQEIADCVEAVQVLDRETRRFRWLSRVECHFKYRTSLFKSEAPGTLIVLRARFKLHAGRPPTLKYPELLSALKAAGIEQPSLADVRRTVLELRRSKSMLLEGHAENARSCGSFFLNPVVDREVLARLKLSLQQAYIPAYPQADGRLKLSAAWLIEQAGFRKGDRHGNVGLSTRHALALTTEPAASAREVVEFAWKIRQHVESCFGIRLRPEPAFLGFETLEDGLPLLW